MLRIEFKDGEAVTYDENSYTDYSYDRKCFIVSNGNRWVGIYNMDCVACVTVDTEETT